MSGFVGLGVEVENLHFNKFPGNDDVARVPCSEKQNSGTRKIPFLRKIPLYISLSIPVALN